MQGNCVEAIPVLSPAPPDRDALALPSSPSQAQGSARRGNALALRPCGRIHRPPSLQTRVSVIVPVRNEAATLPSTLGALARQVNFQGQALAPDSYEIIVFANNCTDHSAALVRQFAQGHPQLQLHLIEQTLPPDEAHIGRVRQILMDEAYHRLRWVGTPRGIIASTDGDSRVDPQWIAAMLWEIDCGADALGGRTVIDRDERAALDAATRATYLRFVGYRYLVKQLEDYLDPDPFDRAPRHYQFFGANFAVTYEMYALVGGLPPLPTSEDVAFHRALVRVGARVRHSLLMRVTTSARQCGRASLGLADRLSQFQTLGQTRQAFLVEPAAAIEAKLLARADLRRYWQHYSAGQPLSVLAPPQLVQLATRLAVPRVALQEAVELASSWGDLYQRVEQCQQSAGLWQQQWGAVAIEEAIADLRLRLNYLRHSADHP
jgi:hypothetical protein